MARLAAIFSQSHERRYPKGQIILYQNESTPNTFYIREGIVKVYQITAQGTEKIILLLGKGDLFPLSFAFSHLATVPYFYESFTDVRVGTIPKTKLKEAVDTDHNTAREMVQYLVRRTRALMLRIECIEATSAKHKVAQVLSYLARNHGQEWPQHRFRVRIPLTHQTIADMAGVTRETASLQLKEMEHKKIIKKTRDTMFVRTDRLNDLLEAL